MNVEPYVDWSIEEINDLIVALHQLVKELEEEE